MPGIPVRPIHVKPQVGHHAIIAAGGMAAAEKSKKRDYW
jgi:hypothetical protein